MPPKNKGFIGPLREGQIKADKRDYNVIRKAKKAIRKARKAKAKAQSKAVVVMKQPARHANIQLPIGAAGQTMVSGKWPQAYFRRGGKGGQNSVRFCVPMCRYGSDGTSSTSTLPGAGGLTYLGTTAKFTQALTFGPGWSLNKPGSSVAVQDMMLWLNYQVGYAAIQYSQYRVKRLKFHFVPTVATTASARAMWAGFFPDPAIVCTEAKSANTLNLAVLQSSGDAICFPAWQVSVLHAKPRTGWLNTNQPFADGTMAATGADLYAMVASYLELHCAGTLVVMQDYTNAGGAPIVDGYVFAEAEVEFKEPMPQLQNMSAPTVDGRKRAILQEQKVEMKTDEPVGILDPREPLTDQQRRQARLALIGQKLSSELGDDVEVIVEEKRQ